MSKSNRNNLISAYTEAQEDYKRAYKGVVNYHIEFEGRVKYAAIAAGGAGGAFTSLGFIGSGLAAPFALTLIGAGVGYIIYSAGSKLVNAKSKQIEAMIYKSETLRNKGIFKNDTQYIYKDLKNKQNVLYDSHKELSDYDADHPGIVNTLFGFNAFIYTEKSISDLSKEAESDVRNEFICMLGVDKGSPVFDLIEGL